MHWVTATLRGSCWFWVNSPNWQLATWPSHHTFQVKSPLYSGQLATPWWSTCLSSVSASSWKSHESFLEILDYVWQVIFWRGELTRCAAIWLWQVSSVASWPFTVLFIPVETKVSRDFHEINIIYDKHVPDSQWVNSLLPGTKSPVTLCLHALSHLEFCIG